MSTRSAITPLNWKLALFTIISTGPTLQISISYITVSKQSVWRGCSVAQSLPVEPNLQTRVTSVTHGSIGFTVGDRVGLGVGRGDGACVGLGVGPGVGLGIGAFVDLFVGLGVDRGVGAFVDLLVGLGVGRGVGSFVELFVGRGVGAGVGRGVGCFVDLFVGRGVGLGVGIFVGFRVGLGVGGIDFVLNTNVSRSVHLSPFGGIASTRSDAM